MGTTISKTSDSEGKSGKSTNKVTLQDIKLKKYSFENLPLLKRLRKELLSKKPAVCIERAKYFTEYLRDMASA